MILSKINDTLVMNRQVDNNTSFERSYKIYNIQPEQNMAMLESTLSSVLRKHEANPYSENSKPQYTFYLQLSEWQNVLKIQLDLEPITLVSDALLLAVDAFNKDLLETQGKALAKNIEFYVPRLPKKNGKAKTDMPCLDINQKLSDIKLTSIAIQIKQPEKAILAKKLEHDESKTKKSDTKCTIMVEMSDRSAMSNKKYSEQIDDHELCKAEKQNSCFCSFC